MLYYIIALMTSLRLKIFSVIFLFLAITPNLGFFNIPSFILLVFSYGLLIRAGFASQQAPAKPEDRSWFIGIVFILFALASLFYGGLYQDKVMLEIGKILHMTTLVFLFYKTLISKTSGRNLLIIALAMYSLIAILTLKSSPTPIIDAFIQMKEAPLAFLQGMNPYDIVYTKIYANVTPDYFTFLPMGFLLPIPFVLILGDPRYLLLTANIIAALVIYSQCKRNKQEELGAIAAAGFLFLPRAFYMLEHMFLDQLVFAFYSLWLFTYLAKKTKLWLLLLAMFFTFKQHLLLLLPLFLGNKNIKNHLTIKNAPYFALPFLPILYFLVINPGAFLNDTLVSLTSAHITSPINISLSLSTFLRNAHFQVDNLGYLLVSLAVTGIVMFLLARKKTVSLTLKIAITLFTFHLLLHHSFFNHYYLIACFLYLDIILDLLGEKFPGTSI